MADRIVDVKDLFLFLQSISGKVEWIWTDDVVFKSGSQVLVKWWLWWGPRYEEIRENGGIYQRGAMGGDSVIEAHGQTWSDGQIRHRAVKMSTNSWAGDNTRVHRPVSGHWVSVVNHVTLITTEGAASVIISTKGDAKQYD